MKEETRKKLVLKQNSDKIKKFKFIWNYKKRLLLLQPQTEGKERKKSQAQTKFRQNKKSLNLFGITKKDFYFCNPKQGNELNKK